MKSQFGVTSSFLMKSSFSKIRFLRIKSEILLEFVINWLLYVNFFVILYLTLFVTDITCITSNLDFHDFLLILSYARQKVMTSAKGSACIQNLCYKCYNNLIFIPSLLQIERILKKLQREFHRFPPTQHI